MDPESAELDIGPYLKELRGDRSLRQVARDSGVSDPFLSQIEKGQRNPGLRILRKLADFYEVSLNDLLRRAGYLEEVEDPYADEGGQRGAGLPVRGGRPQVQFRHQARWTPHHGGEKVHRRDVRTTHR